MEIPLHLPIRPSGQSLEAHILALDKIAVQLSQLPSRTRWPARIPLNSKASFSGELTHANEVKVNVGDGWWIEMTAEEARKYIARRKTAVLLEHARMTEGPQAGSSSSSLSYTHMNPVYSAPEITFNPLFAVPQTLVNYDQPHRELSKEQPNVPPQHVASSHGVDLPREPPPAALESGGKSPTTDKASVQHSLSTATSDVKATGAATKTQTEALTELISSFVDNQRGLANGGTGSKAIPSSDDIMVNEEGLPILEIREDEHGSLIGPTPEPVGESSGLDEIGGPKADDDYWGEAAVARRAALRRRLFSEDTDSDEDEEDGVEDAEETAESVDNIASSSTSHTTPPINIQAPQLSQSLQSPQSSQTPLTLRPSLTTSSSTSQPKGILKPPPRKKSVSFDTSLPSPPASPDHSSKPTSTRINGISFPQPVSSSSNVPLLKLPTPSKAGERGFAGFKKGFLDSARGADKGKGKEKEKLEALERDEVMPKEQAKGGKSLFAQRMRGGEKGVIVEASEGDGESGSRIVNEGGSGSGSANGVTRFPKMSESRGTASVKNSVVEKPPMISPTVRASKPDSEDSKQGVKEGVRCGVEDGDGTGGREDAGEEESGILELEDIDSDDDAYDIDSDEEEEEEYDLDTALLAREAALELHRLRAHNHLITNPYTRTPLTTHPDLEDGEYADPETGVMLALPSVSGFDTQGRPMIVAPSADDLRKSVRVGKLENGNLVLDPGEAGWSDDEEVIGEVREEKQRNRERAKRILLGMEVEERKADGGRKVKVDENEDEEDVGLPPTVLTDAVQAVSIRQPTRDVVESVRSAEEVTDAPAPVKKMSKFKAARMGL